MSGLNRLLVRRDKTGQKRVMSSPLPKAVSVSDSLSHSTSMPTSLFKLSSSYEGWATSSSLCSLSLAFTSQTLKRSPSFQVVDGIIHSSTANTSEDSLLQPKQTAGLLYDWFPEEVRTDPTKDDEKKIKALSQRLARAGITNFKELDIGYVLSTPYAKGDAEKAYDVLKLLEESEQGIMKIYDPNVKLLGAINREGVSCYLDSVLFAMFARPGSFEAILYNNFEDEPRKRLAILLRLWVNTLRAGKLITTDITKQIQLRLADCGWKEAATTSQQDASEAFSFITETLALPLLTLKMDIYHTGKEDATDDHKFVNERLLDVAVPDDPADGRTITLEECLEMYFNNRIEVRRYLEQINTVNSKPIRRLSDSSKASVSHVETLELIDSQLPSPLLPQPLTATTLISPTRSMSMRQRAPSIIKECLVSEKSDFVASTSPTEADSGYAGRKRAGSLRKEILMPAWQFYSLIPWYTDNKPITVDSEPRNNAQVAAHFSSTRPILGICLKRYKVLSNGQARRRSTHVDIPFEIALPHFIQDDALSDDGLAFRNFKLSLQSAVCHRGQSIDSGHYVSIVRSQAPSDGSTDRVWNVSSTDGSERETWMRLDDLAKERVTNVDVEEFLLKESPYLLFYQIQPIEGDPSNIMDNWRTPAPEEPPSYAESESRQSGVADRSSCAHDDFNTNGDVAHSRGHSCDEANFHDEELSINESSIPSRVPIINATPEIGVAGDTLHKHSATDPSYLTTSQRDSRGRRLSRTSEKGLSRSLSRLAGRLKKDRTEDALTIEITGSIPRVTESHSTTDPVARTPKHKADDKANGVQAGHQHVLKGKQKPAKPERECSVM